MIDATAPALRLRAFLRFVGLVIAAVLAALGLRRRLSSETGPLLGHDDQGRAVLWPAPSLERASHVLVLAASGVGKSVVIASALVQELLVPGNDECLLLVDCKGDVASLLLSGLAALAPDRLRDVRYLDPFSDGAFAFNLNDLELGRTPLDIRAMQLAELAALVSTASGHSSHGAGQRQLDVLTHVILGALACEGDANVLWALDALTTPRGLARLASLTRSERARQFLRTTKLTEELQVSCAARLRSAFAASESLERLVGADGSIQFAELLAPRAITIVHLGNPTGGLTMLTAHWANLIVRLAVESLMTRPSPFPGHHARVVIDEAQLVAPVLADKAELCLTTGRSRNVSLVTISQGTTLIKSASETLLRVLMQNVNYKLIGRLSAPDAELLAREQSPAAGVDVSVSETRTGFTAKVTNLDDRVFLRITPGETRKFVSAPVDLAGWQRRAAERAGLVDAAKTRLALPSDTTARTKLPDPEQPTPARAKRPRRGRAPEAAAPGPDADEPRGAPAPPRPASRGRWG